MVQVDCRPQIHLFQVSQNIVVACMAITDFFRTLPAIMLSSYRVARCKNKKRLKPFESATCQRWVSWSNETSDHSSNVKVTWEADRSNHRLGMRLVDLALYSCRFLSSRRQTVSLTEHCCRRWRSHNNWRLRQNSGFAVSVRTHRRIFFFRGKTLRKIPTVLVL
jgi:hypothetical protein